METSNFTTKLNKLDGNVWVAEEEVHPVAGIYEADLQHDNINEATLSVHTGPRLTGDQITDYALSTPSSTPWRRTIRLYSSAPAVYISYETGGDTVEADDINSVQDAVMATQTALNAEEARAKGAERELAEGLQTETDRAMLGEKRLDGRIDSESGRAQDAEKILRDNLAAETQRAQAAEKDARDNLAAETARAEKAEKALAEDLAEEAVRAAAAEKANADAVSAEESRAMAAEKKNSDSIELHTRSVAAEVKALQDADTALDLKKASKTDVEAALAERYTKSQTFSRQEVLDKIEALIGSAPDTLDTFREIADALGNDPNFATTIMNALAGKVDREDGKALSSNNYSDDEKAKVQASYEIRHSHSNKSVLDKITQTFLDNWTDAYNKRHEHGNKGVLDGITSALITAWNSAVTHISDAVKHITAAERTNWNDADSKKHTHTNKAVLDTLTQALLTKWNGVDNKVDKVTGKALSTNDYTTAEKQKLAGIAAGAGVNVQPDWSITDTASDAYIKNRPSSMPASDVSAWAKASAKPSYSWTEIGSKPSAFTPSSHTHTQKQITDMPSKLSQFTNDPGYITAADVDTSQNHTHANKTVLDTITQTAVNNWNTITNKVDKVSGKDLSTNDFTSTLLNKLNGIDDKANKYTHPVTSGNKHIPSGGSSGQILRWGADGTAVWGADNNTTYSGFKGAASSAAGTSGLVPAPAAGKQGQFLRGDGTWNTPANTTYGTATQTANGLMAAADKKKLDGIATGAQANSITGVKGNAESSYRTGNINLTPANIGAANASHTHNYAASSSAGGAATKAIQDSDGKQISTTYVRKGCTWNSLMGV